MQVVVVGSDSKSGKLRFSVSGVDRVLEQNHYRDYREENKEVEAGSLGSLGDLLRAKLGLESSPEAQPPAPIAASASPKQPPAPPSAPPRAIAQPAAAVAKPPPGRPAQPVAGGKPESMPEGVHRRRR